MEKYYITRIKHEEALPFALEYTDKAGLPFPYEWAETWKNYIVWYGTREHHGDIKGVLGLMMSSKLPNELCAVGLYGDPKSIKMLLNYFLGFEHTHKFGHVEVSNKAWHKALEKRYFKISSEPEVTSIGTEVFLAEYVGASHE
jgi:hypothetical protein